jgi:hypothetical protein
MKAFSRFRWTALALVGIVTVMAIRLLGVSDTVERDGLTYAGPKLARVLENGRTAPGARVLAEFAGDGVACRAFLGSDVSGIACKEHGGWHLRLVRDGVDLEDPAAVKVVEHDLRAAAKRMGAQ